MTIEMEAAESAADRRTRAVSRALALACALLLAFGVVGLVTVGDSDGGGVAGGGSGRSGSPLRVVLAAASKTSDAKSARVSMDASLGGASMGDAATHMEGAMTFGEPVQFKGTTTVMGQISMELVLVGNVEYIKLPGEMARGTGLKTPWVSIDVSAVAGAAKSMGGGLGGMSGPSIGGGNDPTAVLQALQTQGMVKTVTEAGTATVRGTSTRVYKLVLDGAVFKKGMGELGSAMGVPGGVFDSVQLADPLLDLYVDADGLVRREVSTVELSGGEGPLAGFKTTTTFDMFDFNTPVDVSAPPANQVTAFRSLSEFMTAMARGTMGR